MRPLSLKLRNFIGIRSGLNRDELSIDLSQYRGLVAIVGENGTGKTTLLDSLTPYRLMAYRADGHSPRQFSYYDETFGDALKELVWEHGGKVYRSEIIIKGTNKTKSTKAYLYVQTPDGWAPVSIADGTVSDGKTDTYDECVNAILGSPEMFFTAVFSAQNRKQIADYGAGEIKLLLSDLLGLEPLLDMSERAAEAAKYQQARYDGLSGQLAQLSAVEADQRTAASDVGRLTEELTTARTARTAAREQCAGASMALAEARAAAANQDDNARRRADVLHEIAAADRDHQATRLRITGEADRETENAKCTALNAELSTLEADATHLQRTKARLDAAIAAAPLEDSSEDLARLLLEMGGLDVSMTEARANAAALADAPGEVREIAAQMKALSTDGQSLVAQIEGHQKRAELVGKVPCVGMDVNAACPLLKDAHGAKAQAEALTSQAAKKREEYSALMTRRDAALAREQQHKAAVARVEALEAQRKTIQADIDRCRREELALATAKEARTTLTEVQATIARVADQIATKKSAIAAQAATANARLAALREEFSAAKEAHATRIARYQAQLASIPEVSTAQTNLAAAEQAQRTADELLADIDHRISRAQQALAEAEAKKRAADSAMRGADAVRQEASALAEDVAQWRLLAKGLGRDGVVALSIDDAGPTISSIANELLTECYGPRFSLRFDTQAETKAGTMKETFDVRVFDAERGDDKSITKTSGGERVWLNDCLCRAIALFRAQQSGQSYACLFSDEADGALSEERKQHFVRVKRKVLEIGGYSAEFLISHSAEVVAEVDHVIDMNKFREAA